MPDTLKLPNAFIGAVPDEWELFSDNPRDYTRGVPIGFGASSIVYDAVYEPPGHPPVPCALKVLDLDVLAPNALRLLVRETQLMSLSKHPNVLRVRGSWNEGHKLYIAMRLMNSGSAADIIRYGWPTGMEEEVVKCILKQALEGLNYLHINGFIHRDIKAANMLIDDDGTVLLGDLGVAVHLSDDETPTPPSKRSMSFTASAEPQRTSVPRAPKLGKRKSFVGTPCWMAPEIIAGRQYDSKADIWSFGITALELTQGRAPKSREPPAKVLLKTLQEAPPLFERQGVQYKYSKAFKEVVESCLVKDPAMRPTAAQLLDTPFFKSAKRKNFLVSAILRDLPPLTKRQERRALPASHHSRTLDSWDFSLTLPISPNLCPVLDDEGVFQLDEVEGQPDFNPIPDDNGVEEDDSQSFSDAEDVSSAPATPELTPSNSATTPISCSPYALSPDISSMAVPSERYRIQVRSPGVVMGPNYSQLDDAPSSSPPKTKSWMKFLKGGKTEEKLKSKPLAGRLWGAVEDATLNLSRRTSRGGSSS